MRLGKDILLSLPPRYWWIFPRSVEESTQLNSMTSLLDLSFPQFACVFFLAGSLKLFNGSLQFVPGRFEALTLMYESLKGQVRAQRDNGRNSKTTKKHIKVLRGKQLKGTVGPLIGDMPSKSAIQSAKQLGEKTKAEIDSLVAAVLKQNPKLRGPLGIGATTVASQVSTQGNDGSESYGIA